MAEFVIHTAADGQWRTRAARALRARTGAGRLERATWLDTHDWRLHRAGLRLVHRVTDEESRWVLTDVGGRTVARAPAPPVPSVPADLPKGPLRDRVAPVVGIRALVPRAEVRARRHVLSVLDDEDKTVARVVVHGTGEVTDGEDVPATARVEHMRGYEPQAERVERALDGLPEALPATGPRAEMVLHAAGAEPGGYRSKPDVPMAPEEPAGTVLAATLGQLAGVAGDNVDGLLLRLDTEFLHDLRVAVRRNRALVKAARGLLPEETRTHFSDELRWLGRATSDSRDWDVHLLDFDALVGPVADFADFADFRELLERRRDAAHAELARVLRSRRFEQLLEDWEARLADPETWSGQEPAGDAAARLLRRARRRVEKRGRAIDEDSPDEALHDLRKRCKELRYLLEAFAGLYPDAEHRPLVRRLKRLQRNLGALQDARAQMEIVAGATDELRRGGSDAATLAAMARLATHLEEAKGAARAEFAGHWARFDRARDRRRQERMVAWR